MIIFRKKGIVRSGSAGCVGSWLWDGLGALEFKLRRAKSTIPSHLGGWIGGRIDLFALNIHRLKILTLFPKHTPSCPSLQIYVPEDCSHLTLGAIRKITQSFASIIHIFNFHFCLANGKKFLFKTVQVFV